MAGAAKRVFEVNRLYQFRKPDILDDPLRSKLPEAYKKFYKEWKLTLPSPVHYIPRTEKYERLKTGQVVPVQTIPIRPRYPIESDKGLWGGEGVVQGFVQKEKRYAAKTPHFWFPALKRSVVYSEILDKYMSIILTKRTIDLILDNHGLDHYLLKTRACDIQSELGVKLKRKMLLALSNRDLYPDNLEKHETVYNKYKHYLEDYTKEEIEWYGLNMYEALIKYDREVDSKPPVPLKYKFRSQLIDQLKEDIISELSATSLSDNSGKPDSKSSWISKINPFKSTDQKT